MYWWGWDGLATACMLLAVFFSIPTVAALGSTRVCQLSMGKAFFGHLNFFSSFSVSFCWLSCWNFTDQRRKGISEYPLKYTFNALIFY